MENYLQKTAVLNSTMAHQMPAIQAEHTRLLPSNMAPGWDSPYQAQFEMRSDSPYMGQIPMIPNGIAPRSISTPPNLLDYDALDHENGPWVPDNDDVTDNDLVHSDFSTIDPNTPVADDNDFFDPFQGTDAESLSSSRLEETPPGFLWPNEGSNVSTMHYMP